MLPPGEAAVRAHFLLIFLLSYGYVFVALVTVTVVTIITMATQATKVIIFTNITMVTMATMVTMGFYGIYTHGRSFVSLASDSREYGQDLIVGLNGC